MIITDKILTEIILELRLHNEEYSHRTDETFLIELERKLHQWELERRSKIVMITTAYEQGYGHAMRVELHNPYVPGSDEALAWDEGRAIGRLVAQRKARQDGKG